MLGGCRRSVDFILIGSWGARIGARTAVITRTRMSRPPSAPSGLLRMTRTNLVTADMSTRLSEADPRVEEAVDHVDHEVQHDDARGEEEIDALDDGIVTPGDGVEQELPHAGQ